KSVGHIPLSYSKEDSPKLTDQFMVQLAKEYLKAMNIKKTQYIIVRHENTDNPHCHIIFNRVDNDGKTISDKNDHYLNEKVCKQLKDKYNLTYGKGKERTNIQKLKGGEKTKYEIYHAVKSALKQSENWTQFESSLKQQGITISYKYKGKTNEVQGLSFKKGDYSFKGSNIDRNFSYYKINKQLSSNTQQNNNQTFSIKGQPACQKQNQNQSMQGQSIIGAVLDGLEEIGSIHQNGEDFEEEAFRRRIEYEEKKRRRKKGIRR
ncbi:relaxase/mobilization nuclease domain-containing protein, partial [Dysgonomonas capnocytophagoides]|uniref:relaxase/mobilization nuclease domain-containing protein n=1 Tax=Dysgonomonas capnocytophagoides TaxID=45254 RepID=UPI002A820FD4